MIYRKYVKRIIDILLSLILIIILSPLIIIVGIITLISVKWPIFDIRYPREGKNKKPFYMLKFRTRIYDDNSEWGRKTKFTKALDNSKLNELPQLFNVLIGDMSMVGPRAFICGEELPKGKISPKRYLVKPGLTGLSQIYNDATMTHKKKLEYDEVYYDNMGFLYDTKIMLKTILKLFKIWF